MWLVLVHGAQEFCKAALSSLLVQLQLGYWYWVIYNINQEKWRLNRRQHLLPSKIEGYRQKKIYYRSHHSSFPSILSPAHIHFLVLFQSFPCSQILWTQENCLWFRHGKWKTDFLRTFICSFWVYLVLFCLTVLNYIFSRSYNMITSLEPFWIDFKWSSKGLFANTWSHLPLWMFSSHYDQRTELISLALLFASGRFLWMCLGQAFLLSVNSTPGHLLQTMFSQSFIKSLDIHPSFDT